MKKVNRKELTIDKLTAPDGKLIIVPFKHMTRTVETTDFELKDAPEGVDPTSPEYEPEYVPVKKKDKAPYELQFGEVVAVGNGVKEQVGDTVIYSVKFAKEYDLFKDTLLLSSYDLHGTYAL